MYITLFCILSIFILFIYTVKSTFNTKENILISNYHNKYLKYLIGFYKFFFIAVLLSSQDSERSCICMLRWYLTLQGDNSLKSVERFDHMMFVCRFQAYR